MNHSIKKSPLSTVCDVRTGYTVRGKLAPVEDGGVPAVQLRDLGGGLEFDATGLPLYDLGPSFERYWAGPGDILFRSRGVRNTAVLISPGSKTAAVAVLPLLVLRPDRSRVDPAYLSWFINQKPSQQYFDKCARGTQLRMIPKKDLEDLEIVLPRLETQRLIVEIASLARREQELARLLADKKLEFTEFALHQQMRNAQLHSNGAGR